MLIVMEKLKMSWKDDLWIGLMLQVQWCTHTCGYFQGISILSLFYRPYDRKICSINVN